MAEGKNGNTGLWIAITVLAMALFFTWFRNSDDQSQGQKASINIRGNAYGDVAIGQQQTQVASSALHAVASKSKDQQNHNVNPPETSQQNTAQAVVVPQTPIFEAPVLVVFNATNVTPSSARLNGTFNFKGQEGNLWFEYSKLIFPIWTRPLWTYGTGNNTIPISQDISGLSPGRTYSYRLVAKINGQLFKSNLICFRTISISPSSSSSQSSSDDCPYDGPSNPPPSRSSDESGPSAQPGTY